MLFRSFLARWLEVSDSVAAAPRRWCDVQVSCAGPAMPTRAEDYEVLYTIGTGSYGRCQKIRRKSDGKVSAGSAPVSAPAAVLQTAGGAPSAAEGKRGAWGCASGRQGAQKSQPSPPRSVSVLSLSRDGKLCRFFLFIF